MVADSVGAELAVSSEVYVKGGGYCHQRIRNTRTTDDMKHGVKRCEYSLEMIWFVSGSRDFDEE